MANQDHPATLKIHSEYHRTNEDHKIPSDIHFRIIFGVSRNYSIREGHAANPFTQAGSSFWTCQVERCLAAPVCLFPQPILQEPQNSQGVSPGIIPMSHPKDPKTFRCLRARIRIWGLRFGLWVEGSSSLRAHYNFKEPSLVEAFRVPGVRVLSSRFGKSSSEIISKPSAPFCQNAYGH